MSSLHPVESGPEIPLSSPHLVGRGPECDLVLANTLVSTHHARLAWTGHAWEIRDLSSKNGTWVDDRAVPPGADVPLRDGAVVRFGPGGPAFRLAAGRGPVAFARGPDGRVVLGSPALLLLGEVPLVRTRAGWVAERDAEAEPVSDRGTLAVDGEAWKLFLPSEPAPGTQLAAPALREGRVELVVSPDEEHVAGRFVHGEAAIDLGERACLYLLATLARARSRDEAEREPDPGWRTRETLAASLRVPARHVNLDVHRCRRLFEAQGLRDVDHLIERRRGELRVGVEVQVVTAR